ncbi:MAG: hypothetical protein OK438_04125 [Thaumarchaeota archaeon]|nr:hypothetical protein [Nitrososphaerota archaeon]
MSTRSALASAEFVNNSKVRLGLLVGLITGPKSTSQLATLEKKHVSHVSRALTELKARGIVEPIPRGTRETFYRLTTQGYVIYTVLSRSR